MKPYDDFLRDKTISVRPSGFVVEALNRKLFDFQRDIVRWSLRKGKAAIFADCGLGKTPMQLEWAAHVAERYGRVLIFAPLAVSQQTKREGEKFDVSVTVCRQQSDVQDGVNIANYEMLEQFDPSAFAGLVCDESSILKGD